MSHTKIFPDKGFKGSSQWWVYSSLSLTLKLSRNPVEGFSSLSPGFSSRDPRTVWLCRKSSSYKVSMRQLRVRSWCVKIDKIWKDTIQKLKPGDRGIGDADLLGDPSMSCLVMFQWLSCSNETPATHLQFGEPLSSVTANLSINQLSEQEFTKLLVLKTRREQTLSLDRKHGNTFTIALHFWIHRHPTVNEDCPLFYI